MRRLALISPLVLAACATAPAETALTCQSAGTDHFIGRPGTSEAGSAIIRATHSSMLLGTAWHHADDGF